MKSITLKKWLVLGIKKRVMNKICNFMKTIQQYHGNYLFFNNKQKKPL